MMSSARPILTVFGDDAVGEVVADHLTAIGKFRLVKATTLYDASASLHAASFDAVFLDVRLPDGNGIEFCSTLRSLGYKMPIILLRDGAADVDVVQGLNAGANDYITDITRPRELLARLHAQLRAFDDSLDATLIIGPFAFRPSEKLLLSPQTNRRILLTAREVDLLKFLHRAGGSYVTRQLLLNEVWGYKTGVVSATLETHIYKLRKKMGIDSGSGVFISMPGGYRLGSPTSTYALSGVATLEPAIMLERQREGVAKAEAEGKYKGREPTVAVQFETIHAMHATGVKPAHIARKLGVARSSVYRILEVGRSTMAITRVDGISINEWLRRAPAAPILSGGRSHLVGARN